MPNLWCEEALNKIKRRFVRLMSKKLFAVIVTLLFVVTIKAQTDDPALHYKNEVSIGIGMPAFVRYGNEAWFESAAVSSSIRFFRYLKKNLAVGGSLGFAWGRRGVGEEYVEYQEGNVHHSELIALDYRYYNSFYLMGGAKWSYINKEYFCMYMRGAFGVQRQRFWYDGSYNLGGTYDLNKVKAAAQISPFGIEGGYKFIHGFLEIGFGMEGIINIGVSYRFGS